MLLYTGIPYGSCFDTPTCRVSLDNVRLKFLYKSRSYDFEKHKAVDTLDFFAHLIDRLFFDNCDTAWKRSDFFKIGNYLRTCTISGIDAFTGEWSCAVLFGRYGFSDGYIDPETGEKVSGSKLIHSEVVLDCNPNKVPDYMISKIVSLLRDGAVDIEFQRYDIAFDFPIRREDVSLLPNERQSYKLFVDATTRAKTEYLGERSSHAAMKLYDKTKESSLSVPVTRCELTVGGDYVCSLEKLFPTLTASTDLQLGMEFDALPFSVKACILHPDLLPTLKSSVDRKTWKKFQAMILSYQTVSLSPGNWEAVDRYIATTLYKLKGGNL